MGALHRFASERQRCLVFAAHPIASAHNRKSAAGQDGAGPNLIDGFSERTADPGVLSFQHRKYGPQPRECGLAGRVKAQEDILQPHPIHYVVAVALLALPTHAGAQNVAPATTEVLRVTRTATPVIAAAE